VSDDESGWRRLLFAATAATALVYLYIAFFHPLTFTYDPLAIQDDVRDFLLWGARITDPGALPGDYMADYWQSVSPPLFRWIFYAGAGVGIRPYILAKFLPLPLLFICAAVGWRLAMTMTGNRPRAAFIAASFLLAGIIHEDSIFSGTPRSFSPALLLILFYAIVSKRDLIAGVAILLLAAFYPASAIVGFTMFALSKVTSLRPPRVDLSLRSILFVGGTAVLMTAAVMPFLIHANPWGPTLTLAQAHSMPNMMTLTGRSTIVGPSGGIGWLCSSRMGYFPAIISCGGDVPAAFLLDLPLALPMIVLAVRAARKIDPGPDRLYLVAFAATLIWYAIAIVVAFRLHLPSRYSQRVLEVLVGLAIGQLIGGWLESRRSAVTGKVRAASIATFTILSALYLTPITDVRHPADPQLIAHIAALPPKTRIGGVSDDLDFIPALTGRSVLAAPEQAVPYQLGYYNKVAPSLRASLVMVSTPDVNQLRQTLSEHPADYILAEREMLDQRAIDGRFPTVLPAESQAASLRLQTARPAFLATGARCVNYASKTFLLVDTRCLLQSPRPVRAGS
jgi:hypothetical protein